MAVVELEPDAVSVVELELDVDAVVEPEPDAVAVVEPELMQWPWLILSDVDAG